MPNHKELLQLLIKQDRSLSRIYSAMARELAIVLKKYKVHNNSKLWFKNVAVRKEVDVVLKKYQKIVLGYISNNVKDAWDLSNNHNDAFVDGYLKGIEITDKHIFYQRNIQALTSFIQRGKNGFQLSDRVWNLTAKTREQLEYFIAEGLTEGRSAVKLATDIKRYLREPEKRFRRIRDKETGKLKLSNPAKDYRPGRGVYRSSYKNALRLTRNEINIAYRTADNERRKQLSFVTGVEVHLSPAHPQYDICDELQGEYPKEFVFTGWHPNCLCFTTSKLLPKEEFIKQLRGEKISAKRTVKSIPKRAKKYLKKDFEKLSKLKSKPYFIEDNFKQTKDGYILKQALIETKE